ncbi:UPF0149 family protein [Wenzhouxiangella sp. EGI_FJ10305]|uniref:UPF0149 family protein n=1 Tax=Wenzhouxiangella sp. EGI_FJ10305 TaxID=3243768 RepID=UPI0035E20A48
MSDAVATLIYTAKTAPEPTVWLNTPEQEREAAIHRWIVAGEFPSPSADAGEWREVEDKLAAGYPPEFGRLLERMLVSGVDRTAAIWALAKVGGARAYEQFNRVARHTDRRKAFAMERLLDDRDIAILPAAFEAARAHGFVPAHGAVIEHYCRHYAGPSAMNLATAAGFCFGCAAAPRLVPGSDRSRHLFGGYDALDAPCYLPVIDAYQLLYADIAEALFAEDDPIPPSCRPTARAGTRCEPPFSDWCRGLASALDVLEADWRAHLEAFPELRADWNETVAILTRFISPESARGDGHSGAVDESTPVYKSIRAATRQLYLLANPILTRALESQSMINR